MLYHFVLNETKKKFKNYFLLSIKQKIFTQRLISAKRSITRSIMTKCNCDGYHIPVVRLGEKSSPNPESRNMDSSRYMDSKRLSVGRFGQFILEFGLDCCSECKHWCIQ